MLLINVAVVLVTRISPAHADEQTQAHKLALRQFRTLPRPRPLFLDATGDNPAVLISAFRHQHREDSVLISADLTCIAQEQANAIAIREAAGRHSPR